ncbi:MAG TPA: preprotein translocase subunit SecE [Clostridium sp.]|nr:preprotein translocase subunit SecE [Clostridium sp.]
MAQKAKNPKVQDTKGRFFKFFRDIKNELKKVIWPTKTQLINNTLTVLFMCLILGAFIWAIDQGLNLLRALIYV